MFTERREIISFGSTPSPGPGERGDVPAIAACSVVEVERVAPNPDSVVVEESYSERPWAVVKGKLEVGEEPVVGRRKETAEWPVVAAEL
jgi:hypothetical protein